MSNNRNMVTNEGSASVLKVRFNVAGIPINDDGIYQILGGVYNFMRQNSEVWALYKDFVLGVDIAQYDLVDSGTHATAAYTIGQSFKVVMDDFCLATASLDDDHFTFIGVFTIVILTYPAAIPIVETMLDSEISQPEVLNKKSKLIH